MLTVRRTGRHTCTRRRRHRKGVLRRQLAFSTFQLHLDSVSSAAQSLFVKERANRRERLEARL